MGHSRKTRLSFYSNDDSIRTDTLRQKIHDSYWPTAEIHSSRTRIDSNTVEHPPRVWFEAACLSDQPLLLREGSLAECIWSGRQTHRGLSKLWLVSRFGHAPTARNCIAHGSSLEEVVLVTSMVAVGTRIAPRRPFRSRR